MYWILGIVVIILLWGISFTLFSVIINSAWRKQVEKVWDKLRKIEETEEYNKGLFDLHFRVTDKTIIDTRDERDFWKKRALLAEKKSGKLKK